VNRLPLRPGASGESVHDLQRRLLAAGFGAADEPGRYGSPTDTAVRSFQESRGLRVDGICGPQTWSALVEAGWRLGDRLLYLRSPMVRGDDVADLQRRLGALGFDTGRVDGIFGNRTAAALGDFQKNAGLLADAVCGSETVEALLRLGSRDGHGTTVATVHEEERLRAAPRRLAGRRLVVGEFGGLAALADSIGHELGSAGAVVAVLHDPDDARQASEANRYNGEAFVGVSLAGDGDCRVTFYATEGFSSVGGSGLAGCAAAELAPIYGATPEIKGMRIPILRETRMPAILCELGSPTVVVQRSAAIAQALSRACARWVETPLAD
jgi:N-acetylmuramoyl-L-alanine amidase